MLGNSFLCHLKANLRACSWWWNEWLLPLFTTHGMHVVEPRWPKVFQNLCVQVYNIILFITVTAAMLHCKRFCYPNQGK